MARHPVAIVWLRRALRLADNPALAHALETADAVVVATLLPQAGGAWAPGAASRAWRARSLAALHASLVDRGTRLVVRTGLPAEALPALAAECGATLVCLDLAFEPEAMQADAATVATLEAAGLEVRGFNCTLLNEPAGPLTAEGGPFRVFTPYHNACLRLGRPAAPLPAPARVSAPSEVPG